MQYHGMVLRFRRNRRSDRFSATGIFRNGFAVVFRVLSAIAAACRFHAVPLPRPAMAAGVHIADNGFGLAGVDPAACRTEMRATPGKARFEADPAAFPPEPEAWSIERGRLFVVPGRATKRDGMT